MFPKSLQHQILVAVFLPSAPGFQSQAGDTNQQNPHDDVSECYDEDEHVDLMEGIGSYCWPVVGPVPTFRPVNLYSPIALYLYESNFYGIPLVSRPAVSDLTMSWSMQRTRHKSSVHFGLAVG